MAKARIFLVEDEVIVTEVLRMNLERSSYEVVGHELYGEAVSERFLRASGITVDLQKGLAMVANNAVSLTPTELKILVHLMRRPGEVVSLRELGAHLQGSEVTLYEARDLVRAPLHRLRHKIEVDPDHPRFIHTVRGRGYVFEVR